MFVLPASPLSLVFSMFFGRMAVGIRAWVVVRVFVEEGTSVARQQ
jgi:hypothetical protein